MSDRFARTNPFLDELEERGYVVLHHTEIESLRASVSVLTAENAAAVSIVRKLAPHVNFCDTKGVVDSAVIDVYVDLTPEEIAYLRVANEPPQDSH